MRPPLPAILAVVGVVATLLGTPACRDGAGERRPPVLVVAVDGLDWDVLRPLLAEGRCPNLRGLMERGSWGALETMEPTLSPIVWTTIATGRRPEDHGIRGFTHEGDDGTLLPYTSSQRACRAVWNVADLHGRTSLVCGWWITWPVEELRGVMISGSASPAMFELNWKPTLLPGVDRQVYPESRANTAFEVAERVGSVDAVRDVARNVFGDLPPRFQAEELGPVERDLIQQTLWSIQSDVTFAAIARELLPEVRPDLALVYLGTPDVVGHRFWRYYEPERYRWPADRDVAAAWEAAHPDAGLLADQLASPAGAERLADVIPNAYAWFDTLLGELVRTVGEETNIVVVSDHGMHADFTGEPHPWWVTGHHLDAPAGVMVAAGPDIRVADADLEAYRAYLDGAPAPARGHVLSVMPTLLALLGLPPSRELERQADAGLLTGVALEAASLVPVASHDEGFRAAHRDDAPDEMGRNFVDRFTALGYIGEDEE